MTWEENIAVIYDGNTLRLFGNTYSIDVFLYAHKVSRYIFQRYLSYHKRLLGFLLTVKLLIFVKSWVVIILHSINSIMIHNIMC